MNKKLVLWALPISLALFGTASIITCCIITRVPNDLPSARFPPSGLYKKYHGNPLTDFVKAVPSIKNISDPSVFYVDGQYHLWLSCSTGAFSQIYYAASTDGIHWVPHPKPVLAPGCRGSWDDYNSEVQTIIRDGPKYKMWYTGYSHAQPNVYTRIGYATSPDGIHWTRLSAEESPYGEEGVVLALDTAAGEFYCISDPMVLKVNGIYHMWYNTYATKPFNMIAIFHATSLDGIHWKRDSSKPVLRPSTPWEKVGGEGSVVHPTVIWDGTHFEMWYGSFVDDYMRYSAISHAVSSDGSTWIKDNEPALVPGPEHLWPSVSAVRIRNEIRLYYIGFPKLGSPHRLYLATSTQGTH